MSNEDEDSPAPTGTVWNIDLSPLAASVVALAVAWFCVTCAESRERIAIECMKTPRCEMRVGGEP